MSALRGITDMRRLARLLLLMANFGKEARLEVSQQTLAEMIGTTSSRVSFS